MKNKKRIRRCSQAFRSALDLITSREPYLDYEDRCKKAAHLQSDLKSVGIKLSRTPKSERRSKIAQRRRMHVDSEAVLDKQPLNSHTSSKVFTSVLYDI